MNTPTLQHRTGRLTRVEKAAPGEFDADTGGVDADVDERNVDQDAVGRVEGLSSRGRGAVQRAGDREPVARHGTPQTGQHEAEASAKAPHTPPGGYIMSRYALPASVATWVRSLVSELHPDVQRFFFHVLGCGMRLAYEGFWVPVSSELRRRDIPGAGGAAAWEWLVEARLFDEPLPYSKKRRVSRRYRVSEWMREEYGRRLHAALHAGEQSYIDVITGKQARRRRTCLTDTSGNPVGKAGSLLRQGLAVYKKAYLVLDLEAMQAGLDVREERMQAARKALAYAAGSEKEAQARAAYLQARGAYYNDLYCLASLREQRPTPAPDIGPGLVRVHQPYVAQSSGRVYGDGFQSISKELKRPGCEPVPGAVNYDLKSSQPRILIQRLEEAAEDPACTDAVLRDAAQSTAWLRTYDETPGAKHVYAERAGLSVAAWKELLCATLMGCHHPVSLKTTRRADNGPAATPAARYDLDRPVWSEAATVEKILIEAGYGPDLERAYARVRAVLAPLIDVRDRWHAYLTGPFFERRAYHTCAGWVVVNEAGATFTLSMLPREMNRRQRADAGRRLSAFLLQGLEAAFIHALAALGGTYGFTVLANEHDGLITLGEIPQAAIQAASRRSGLRYAELVEKPFEGLPELGGTHVDAR